VADAKLSQQLFDKLLGVESYKTEEVASEKVNTIFYMVGATKMELVAATAPESAIAKYLIKQREGVHHIALETDDIYAEMERLKNEGFELLMPEPKHGADNKLICFLHPKSCNGILIELTQEIK
jgi:methylmalonyl-CoA/ethylmalonyl-CoA epimerase